MSTHYPLYGGDMSLPCSTRITVRVSPRWRGSVRDTEARAIDIFNKYRGEIDQMVYAGRQRSDAGLAFVVSQRAYAGIELRYVKQFAMEMVLVTIYPEQEEVVSVGSSLTVGRAAKIKWPYTGFPVFGMRGDAFINPENRTVEYEWDVYFTPSFPGATSSSGGGLNKFIGAASPVTEPICPVDDTTNCPDKVAGSAILTTPLSGKQYWEVEIVTLPRGRVPTGFTHTFPETEFTGADGVKVKGKCWAGNTSETMVSKFDQTGTKWWWDAKVDSFLTPCIGICPGYFLPDDLLPGDPTAAPQTYQDYGMILGLDAPWGVGYDTENTYDLARTVYVVATTVNTGATTYTDWIQGHWVIRDKDTHEDEHYMNDSYITDPPPGGDPWPDYKTTYEWGYLIANSYGIYSIVPTTSGGMSRDVGGHFVAITQRTETCITWHGSYLGAAYVLSQYPRPGMPDREGAGCHAWSPQFTTNWEYNTGVDLGPTVQPTPHWCDASGPPKGTQGNHLSEIPTYTELYENFSEAWPSADDQGIYSTYVDNYGWSGPEGTFSYDNKQWNLAAVDGSTDPYTGGTFHHIAGKYDEPVTGDALLSDLFNSYAAGDVPTGAEWSKLYQSGGHAPVFVGRWDGLHLLNEYVGDGSEPDTFARAAPGSPMVASDLGCYTGVDLGKISEGDIIMVATDADTGYVWFGKNGKWYGKDGELDPQTDGPAHGTKWAAVMDGAKKSAYPITTPEGDWDRATAKPQYFPCVSWRLGPGEVSIVYDTAKLEYTPPGGFDVYGQTTVAV